MKKIAIVIGTRPEGIKLAPLINCIKNEFSHVFTPLVISTGQHKEILDDVFDFFNISPHITLSIDRSNSTLSSLQSQLVQSLEAIFIKESPDIVVVQGDTHSTLSGAMAAFYQKIPVAYVESGLRSGNLYEPFPEEANRKMITQLTTWHFTPTKKATHALKAEGIVQNVYEVGNTVIDALIQAKKGLIKSNNDDHAYFQQHQKNRRIVLITVHRRENWGNGLQSIMAAVKQLLSHYEDLDIVWLTHPNPTIKQQVEDTLSSTANIYIYPPANYVELVQLMNVSTIILTDSGGIQEEAPSLNKPVLVAREVTERMEGIDAGCAKLVGVDTNKIVKNVSELLDSEECYSKMTEVKNPYGDGSSSRKILSVLAG
jgi:UDP-N-acetylglucosamine 2-epimerase (non-hydrolysing)